ncbi:COesterase and/or Abhydrolase 3 domain containing protein, partial [Asbolus verrucosus]
KSLIVRIKNGLVRGREDTTVGFNLTYFAYQGIPYAEPPTGDLRFEPPVPKRNWEGVLDATKDGNICVQSSDPVLGSEDCLFINVYVPKLSKFNKQLLPTMVFIYGGGFEAGFSNYNLYGPDHLLERNVVVVTFNYRLGILGFLSTGDLVVPGNNGLKDQVLALKWVRDNIRSFGGDPNQVTIFGQSAGSASVSYHMQSPLSRGLFHRAIMESGVSLCSWAFARRVPAVITQIGKDLLLDTSSSRRLVDELKRVDYKLLQAKSASAVVFQYLKNDPRYGFTLGPVIEPEHDNAFFTNKSHQLLVEGKFSKVPCIIGFNSLEGTFNFGTLFKLYLIQYDFNHSRLLPIDLNINQDKMSTAASYLSDDLFGRPIREYVRQVSKHVPVYFYRFSYEGGLWGFQNRTHPGVAHSEELGYMWRSNFTASHSDLVTRNRLTAMWTDFAKTGYYVYISLKVNFLITASRNPTPEKYFTTSEVIWEKTDEDFTYLEIGHDLNLTKFPEKYNMILWDQIYQVYGNAPYDTY